MNGRMSWTESISTFVVGLGVGLPLQSSLLLNPATIHANRF
jgi:hypothetical protein